LSLFRPSLTECCSNLKNDCDGEDPNQKVIPGVINSFVYVYKKISLKVLSGNLCSSFPANKKLQIYYKIKLLWTLVAHACNPSYSGSRDQED
jgi:hypothetical protein